MTGSEARVISEEEDKLALHPEPITAKRLPINGLNALHLASKEGHLAVVRLLLDHNAVIDAKTKKGNTALHIASLAGRTDIVQLLVDRGADVNARSQVRLICPIIIPGMSQALPCNHSHRLYAEGNGFTPLYMAAQENHADIVQFLLNKGANQALATDDGFTPLAVALQQGHDGVVTLLLDRDAGSSKGRLPALHIAAKKDDVHAATLLLANSEVNVNHTSAAGFTALHIAAHHGNVNVARLLISNGADVNCDAKNNITPLHVAAKWGKVEMVKLLIDRGANVNARTRDDLTPMHCASRSGGIDIVQVLLGAGADHTLKTRNGFTPLHVACKKMKVKVVELLLKHGAAVEATTQAGFTPLHVAAFVGCADAAVLLLQRGANPNQITTHGETPLYLAVRGRHPETIRVLLKNSALVDARVRDHQTALHVAIRANDKEVVQSLLDAGADVNAEARGKYRPLHLAVREGDLEIIRLLLNHGAQVEATTKRGYTAMHIAAKYDKLDVMQLLITEGRANIDAAARNGLTPLHVAAFYGFADVANLLLTNGAKVNVAGKNGFTPLHQAAKLASAEIASNLLKAGAVVDEPSRNGYTALHIAAQEGHVDVVKCLVEEYSAKVSLQANSYHLRLHMFFGYWFSLIRPNHSVFFPTPSSDVPHDGLTPLHLSAQTDKLAIVDLLVSYGADLTAKTLSGFTPLHDACYKGHLPVVRLMLQHLAAEDQEMLQSLLSSRTVMGCTPLHLAAQQGHLQVVSLLLEYGADPNARNMQGWTAAQISNKQHYLNVFETLAKVTTSVVDWEAPSIEGAGPDGISGGDSALVDGTMVLDSPTQMIDRALVESEDESEPKMRISARDSVLDERTRISTESVVESSVQQRQSQLQLLAITPASSTTDWDFEVENVRAARKPVKAGFLVSFLVDARGGFVEAQRRPDLRFLIPPNAVTSPTRIICRLLRPDRVSQLPHLNDGEAFACRCLFSPSPTCLLSALLPFYFDTTPVFFSRPSSSIMEMSPSNLHFTCPILMEVPHFAAIEGRDREILILRCDGGEVWKSHQLEATDQAVQDALGFAFGNISRATGLLPFSSPLLPHIKVFEEPEDQLEPMQILRDRRIQRILTKDIPQFFALVTRFRQEIALIGPEGGIISSTVAPKVQAVFPEGALQKKIKVGLQAQVVPPDVLDKMVGNRIALSPIVTIEPRRRKFHKPITITIPLPRQLLKGESEKGIPSSLRLLCSIVAGTVPAVWEDVTGSTTLTRQKDCVSFTTTVSARLWLVDAPGVPDVTELATRVYQESILPPYMGQFAVYGRLPKDRIALEAKEVASNVHRPKVLHPADAELRCVCLIDDAPEKSLENLEKFQLIAVGPYVEVSDSKPYWIETAGDISSYPSHAGQLSLQVQAFRENRLMFPVRVRQPAGSTAPPIGRLAILREPKGAYVGPEGPQVRKPITTLEIRMPGDQGTQWPEADELEKAQTKLDLPKISAMVGKDWVYLAHTLGMTPEDIDMLAREPLMGEQSGPEADRERCEHMLSLWQQRSAATGTPIRENMGKWGLYPFPFALPVLFFFEAQPERFNYVSLADALTRIGRTDAIGTAYEPLKPVAMEAEEEMRVLSSPTTYVQKPPSPPVLEPQIVSSRSPEHLEKAVELLKTYQAELSPPSEELLSKFQEGELMATEEAPPTVVDGTPRVVPTEELPVLMPSEIEAVIPEGKHRDDMSLLLSRADGSRPVENDFMVASEGLKRKEMGPVGPADSYARQVAAEELADALGLDADIELVSVLKQSEEPSAESAVVEDEIKAVNLESKTEVSPVLLRPEGFEPQSPEEICTLGGLHVDTDLLIGVADRSVLPINLHLASHKHLEESGDELRVPSTENLDEGAFEDAFLAAARQDEEESAMAAAGIPQQFSPGPTGRAGHDVFQGRPEEGFLVEQTEEVLPDGTFVKQQVQTEETVQTVSSHDWEEAELAAAVDSEHFVVEPPEESVEIEEVEETLPDGSSVRKLVKIKRITERITEREVSDDVSENEVQEAEELRQYPIAVAGGVTEGSVGRSVYENEQTAEDARRPVKDESVPEDKQQTQEVSEQTFEIRGENESGLTAKGAEQDEAQSKTTEDNELVPIGKEANKQTTYVAEQEGIEEVDETETATTLQKLNEIKVPETVENEADEEEIDGGAKEMKMEEKHAEKRTAVKEEALKDSNKITMDETLPQPAEEEDVAEGERADEEEALAKEKEEMGIVDEEAEAEVKAAVPVGEEEVVVPAVEEA
uniref:ANK_REP_REGION domain-containing protein n=1 Tax=Schistocephalus solidus TaxID=70667 RepID=A0A183SJT3_SCHSO